MVFQIASENKQCSKPEAAAISAGLNAAIAAAAAAGAGQRDALWQCSVAKGAGECEGALQLEERSSLALQRR